MMIDSTEAKIGRLMKNGRKHADAQLSIRDESTLVAARVEASAASTMRPQRMGPAMTGVLPLSGAARMSRCCGQNRHGEFVQRRSLGSCDLWCRLERGVAATGGGAARASRHGPSSETAAASGPASEVASSMCMKRRRKDSGVSPSQSMVKKKTGVSKMPNSVTPSMPLKTAVPSVAASRHRLRVRGSGAPRPG